MVPRRGPRPDRVLPWRALYTPRAVVSIEPCGDNAAVRIQTRFGFEAGTVLTVQIIQEVEIQSPIRNTVYLGGKLLLRGPEITTARDGTRPRRCRGVRRARGRAIGAGNGVSDAGGPGHFLIDFATTAELFARVGKRRAADRYYVNGASTRSLVLHGRFSTIYNPNQNASEGTSKKKKKPPSAFCITELWYRRVLRHVVPSKTFDLLDECTPTKFNKFTSHVFCR